MKQLVARIALLMFAPAVLTGIMTYSVSAQTQSLNAQLEGTVVDPTGAVVSQAEITATNLETGITRVTISDDRGIYRIPLLPLGTYRIVVEATSFKRLVRNGVVVALGQAAVVDLQLEPGGLSETVTVSSDSPVADSGKTDLGRIMNSREVHNIPLPTRNPYNFAILQANVSGRPNRGINYPQFNVNGFARRVNYLLDGNTNTRGDLAGAPLLLISNTYVNEMQLLTPGYAAEFGNTTGMIVNIVTPSGTNELHGSAVYQFRRPSFYARPFFYSGSELPDNVTNNVAVTIGGPIIKDRWHYYFGYEWLRRDDNARANKQVRIRPEDKTALIAAGLSPTIFVPSIPGTEPSSHYIFRTDIQLNSSERLTVRYNHADVAVTNSINGGFNTLERSYNVGTLDHSFGLQLVSYTQNVLNELRIQYTWSRGANKRNESSGRGPSITIPNTANFGSPTDGSNARRVEIAQIQDNLTVLQGSHAVKIGGGSSLKRQVTRETVFSLYRFPSIQSYVSARNGALPFGYSTYEETFGDPETKTRTLFWNFFVQDDWKVARHLKVNFGLRYDLYLVPDADPTSPFPASRRFDINRYNLAPRLGVVYTLRDGNKPLLLRAGTGIYYEPPWSDMYTRALRDNGTPDFFSIRFCGDAGGSGCPRSLLAPAFPSTFSSTIPPGASLAPQNIVTVAADFANMYALHSSIQLEQALTEDLSLAIGYFHSAGRHIPVYRNINPVNPVRFLSDGRPVFGSDRLDPRFDVIQMAESAGVSEYDALTAQLSKRFSGGFQFAANYTLSRAVDDAPEQNVTYADGSRTLRALSDPTNRSLDKGYSYGDQRHTFVMTLVARPQLHFRNGALRTLFDNNQFGVIATANSGERFSVRTAGDLDLNNDGLFWPDRPVGIKRNAQKTPPQFNLDLRYSRFINFGQRYKLEVTAEIQNLFNINSIVAYNDLTVNTDPITGEMIGPMPDFKARNQSVSLESRQLQIGLRFHF
jgi:hypothetical protein